MFRIYVSALCFGFRIRVYVSVFVLCLCIRVRIHVYIRIHVFCFAIVECFCMRIRFPFLYSYVVLYSCSYACSLQDVDVSVFAFVVMSCMFSFCVRVCFFVFAKLHTMSHLKKSVQIPCRVLQPSRRLLLQLAFDACGHWRPSQAKHRDCSKQNNKPEAQYARSVSSPQTFTS